jgi:heme A synthase
MPSGFKMRNTSALMAASILKPLIEMHRAVPWFVRALAGLVAVPVAVGAIHFYLNRNAVKTR